MRKLDLPSKERPILVAVSGGVDSMVLATLLYENNFQIAVAHCNYELRGKDSDADESLVRSWCLERGLRFYSKRIDTERLVQQTNRSLQMVARDERYGFFEELRKTHGFSTTSFAHHADDRVESLLLNVLRGTGLRGLQGMPSKRSGVIRPLLQFSKKEIRKYADEAKIPFREDRSNQEIHYKRNWIRLRLLPMLEQTDPNIKAKLRLFCERVESEIPSYELWVEQKLASFSKRRDISIKHLHSSKTPFTLLKEHLKSFGFSSHQVFEVLEILDSTSGTELNSDTHRVVKDREHLIVSRLETNNSMPLFQYELLDRREIGSLKMPKEIVLLDADKVAQEKLKCRKWKAGDRFKPLGMKGWKKLSDFFIDEKIPTPDKENVWLLEQAGNIVWVVGMRPDERFKVSEKTKQILKISLINP